ncbi:MAG: methyltransferase domain-containing protein [Candidatus Sifarchaeia archaeon]|jgi:SAM-dependent methyltransferase
MHPRVYTEFEIICSKRAAGGVVLEIGAVPSDASLLNMRCLNKAKEKIGVNLDGPYNYKDFSIIKGNANSMEYFEDNKFDTILCNAVLEHDKFFWKTVSEIRRVLNSNGLLVICAPGYRELPWEKYIRVAFRKIRIIRVYFNVLYRSTFTFGIHNAPGDYYRFTCQSFREVIFDKMKDVEVYSFMLPPRIIGSGFKP